jgi:hypothetical protein
MPAQFRGHLACGARQLWLTLVEQICETLTADELGLFRVVQPIKNFSDEQRLPGAVRFGHVDMSEGRGDVTAKLHEMSQCECRSVEVRFRL